MIGNKRTRINNILRFPFPNTINMKERERETKVLQKSSKNSRILDNVNRIKRPSTKRVWQATTEISLQYMGFTVYSMLRKMGSAKVETCIQ